LFSKAAKIKLIQVILQYVLPRLQPQHIELDQEEKLRNVTVRVLDGEVNSIKEYNSMSDTIQSLDEKDLGLLKIWIRLYGEINNFILMFKIFKFRCDKK